jgi:hypothetical protein
LIALLALARALLALARALLALARALLALARALLALPGALLALAGGRLPRGWGVDTAIRETPEQCVNFVQNSSVSLRAVHFVSGHQVQVELDRAADPVEESCRDLGCGIVDAGGPGTGLLSGNKCRVGRGNRGGWSAAPGGGRGRCADGRSCRRSGGQASQQQWPGDSGNSGEGKLA